STFEEITKTKPEKSLTVSLKKHSGRNNQGKITTRHRGGGAKRAYRLIDFKRNKLGVPAKVAAIEYDPNRSARIALLHYLDGEKRYIIAPLGLKVGDQVMAGPEADIKPGNALPLKNIPTGTTIHNIELTRGRGGQMVRGSVMNPRDHPHGGGEGRAPIGGQPQTPWGKPALGYKTRRNKKTDQYIVRRRNAGRRRK